MQDLISMRAAAAVPLTLVCAACSGAPATARPNIVLIHADDLGWRDLFFEDDRWGLYDLEADMSEAIDRSARESAVSPRRMT